MPDENWIDTERQEAYIEKCRTAVAQLKKELGREPRACVVTFGCQVNTVHEIVKAA